MESFLSLILVSRNTHFYLALEMIFNEEDILINLVFKKKILRNRTKRDG